MNNNVHCKYCINSSIFLDVSGDCVCTECGLVIETMQWYNTQTNPNITSDMSNHMHNYNVHSDTSTSKTIRRYCKKYHFDDNVKSCIREYNELFHLEKNDIKLVCCSINAIEHNISSSNVILMAKRMKLDSKIMFDKIVEIKKQFIIDIIIEDDDVTRTRCSSRSTDEMNETNIIYKDWLKALQDEIIKKTSSLDVDRRCLSKMKMMCADLIKNKPECLYHNTNMLSIIIILQHKIYLEHNIPNSKIKRLTNELFV